MPPAAATIAGLRARVAALDHVDGIMIEPIAAVSGREEPETPPRRRWWRR